MIWAAGRATTFTATSDADVELEIVTALVDTLRSALPGGHGAFFLSSSAGGVYAGNTGAPFSATSLPHPLSPYGKLKLGSESQLDIIALGQLTTVGQLIQMIDGMAKRRVPVSLGTHPRSVAQT